MLPELRLLGVERSTRIRSVLSMSSPSADNPCDSCQRSCECGHIGQEVGPVSPAMVVCVFLAPLVAFIGGVGLWYWLGPAVMPDRGRAFEWVGFASGILAGLVVALLARCVVLKRTASGGAD